MSVWKKVVAGSEVAETTAAEKGNSFQLLWGHRQALGPLGDAYRLWWDSGMEGLLEGL